MKVTLRGVTMRRNDSCNFRIHENLWIKIYFLYPKMRDNHRQKYLFKGVGLPWIGTRGDHKSVRGGIMDRYIHS
jgi:hypothetical protein